MLSIDKEYYNELGHNEGYRNRAEIHEEIISNRRVVYTFSPNGTVEIAVRSNHAPFKIETDVDESLFFSFLGATRDRLAYIIKDPREREVPSLTNWVLKACDLNKDIEINEKCQLTLPDIQLSYLDRVLRLYVKVTQGKALYRVEESVKLNQIVPEALDNIRNPYKSIEDKLSQLSKQLNQLSYLLSEIDDSQNKLAILGHSVSDNLNKGMGLTILQSSNQQQFPYKNQTLLS